MFSRSVLRRVGITLLVTYVAAAVACLSLSLIPFLFEIENGRINTASYIIASLFWSGLLISLISAFLTKKLLSKYQGCLASEGCTAKRQRIGIVSFSKDSRMYIIYGITVLGILLILSDIIFKYVPEVIMFPAVSVTLLSFVTHCVIDGKYYKAYKTIKENYDNDTKRKA